MGPCVGSHVSRSEVHRQAHQQIPTSEGLRVAALDPTRKLGLASANRPPGSTFCAYSTCGMMIILASPDLDAFFSVYG